MEKDVSKGLVSIIIPVYNGEKFLKEAVESVYAQTYKHFEIVVVDDGSTDGTVELVKSYPDIQLIEQEHKGVAAARNNGLSHARGEYIAFIDCDDIWNPDKIEKQINFFKKKPETGVIVCYEILFVQPGNLPPKHIKEDFFKNEHPAYIPSAVIIKKSIFESVGKFNEELEVGEDTDWFARAKDLNIGMTVVPEVLLHKRLHQNNLSNLVDENISVLKKILRESIKRKNVN